MCSAEKRAAYCDFLPIGYGTARIANRGRIYVSQHFLAKYFERILWCFGFFLLFLPDIVAKAQDHTPIELFRGTPLHEEQSSGIYVALRGSGAFSIDVRENGLRRLFGQDVVAKLKLKFLILRIGARAVDLEQCTNESLRDAQECTKRFGTMRIEGPFEITFGPRARPGPPGQFFYEAYLHDVRHKGVYAICPYLLPKNQRLGCAIVFSHDGDEYKIDHITLSDDTDLSLMRCIALKTTKFVWPSVKPFDDLCPE